MTVRRPTRWLIGVALATVALLAAAVALRAPLAERGARAYLAARGFPQASVSVSRIGLERTIIDDLALGPGLPGVGRIELRYRPADLLGLRLRAVCIDGLRATVDGQNPAALARLEGLLPSGGGGDAGGPAVPGPTLDVTDAQIIFRTAGSADVTLALDGTLDLARPSIRASLDGRAAGAFGQASLTLRTDDLSGRPTLRIQGQGNADLTRLPWPERLGPRPQGGTMRFSFSGSSPMPSLRQPAAASLEGPFEARLDGLRAGNLAVKDLVVKGRLGLSGGPGQAVTATLLDGGIEVSSPSVSGDLRIEGPVRLAIPSARLERAPDGRIALDARVLPEGLNATIALPDGRRMAVGISAKEIDAALQVAPSVAGRLRLRGGAIHLPAQDILAERIEATIPLPAGSGGEPALVSATVSMPSGRLAPLVLDARVTAEGGAFLVNGTIASPDHGLRIPLQARYLAASAKGSLALGPATLEFRPNALQPKALGSALAMVTRAAGALDLSGALALAPDAPLDGTAGAQFRDLTVETAVGAVEHLNGAIRLDGLFPPRTAGEQTLSARRVVAGLPLDEPSLRFHLEAAPAGSIVMIDRAEGKIAEGTVFVDGARFDPAAAGNELEIGIQGLSLDRLLRDYAMEGMSGTGTLSGVIPVTFSAAGMAIESGTLRAEGGGVIRVAWGSSRDAMMRQGEQVALMVRALEDFHYSALRLTIDRPADGSLSLKVTMEGHNPAVKDGYPFRFNVALSGELEKILAAIREGGRLGTDLFRGGLGGAP